jgi:hypothetical protein
MLLLLLHIICLCNLCNKFYMFGYVCCNCWKGISVLVTANYSVQQEPTRKARKSLAGKGIKKCYLLLWK